jgi:hypothetical protein
VVDIRSRAEQRASTPQPELPSGPNKVQAEVPSQPALGATSQPSSNPPEAPAGTLQPQAAQPGQALAPAPSAGPTLAPKVVPGKWVAPPKLKAKPASRAVTIPLPPFKEDPY